MSARARPPSIFALALNAVAICVELCRHVCLGLAAQAPAAPVRLRASRSERVWVICGRHTTKAEAVHVAHQRSTGATDREARKK